LARLGLGTFMRDESRTSSTSRPSAHRSGHADARQNRERDVAIRASVHVAPGPADSALLAAQGKAMRELLALLGDVEV
jgi:hypothetical protein